MQWEVHCEEDLRAWILCSRVRVWVPHLSFTEAGQLKLLTRLIKKHLRACSHWVSVSDFDSALTQKKFQTHFILGKKFHREQCNLFLASRHNCWMGVAWKTLRFRCSLRASMPGNCCFTMRSNVTRTIEKGSRVGNYGRKFYECGQRKIFLCDLESYAAKARPSFPADWQSSIRNWLKH